MMRRFCRYIDKVFGLGDAAEGLVDERPQPQIPTGAVWSSAFFMSAMGLGSLNAAEGELKVPRRMESLIGARKPSADTIGRVMGLIDPDKLRAMLRATNHQLRRNKALDDNPWPLRFVALDGHEFFSQSPAPL